MQLIKTSPFEDTQKGEVTLKHIIFKDGTLVVPKEHQSFTKAFIIISSR